jgi:formiminoglutamate deiminase
LSSYWCELAWRGGTEAEPGVLVEIEGERIASVEPAATPPAGATRLLGLTVPGLANAHSHAFQRAIRGRTHAARGDFWSWREQMYAASARLDPDSYLMLARATFAEMALTGITAVGEFHYLHHGQGGRRYGNANAMGEAVIEAAREAGIRITLIDACYLHGGIGREPDEEQLRFSDGSAAAWAERVERLRPGPGVRIGAAIHSVRAVDPASAAEVAAWARQHAAPLHAHLSEQPAENEVCLSAHGVTPAALLAEAGAVDERFTAIHATHLAEADFGLLGGAGASICLCPTTERDLADGVGPARRLAEAGAPLCLGSDSNAVIDLFEEARAVEMDERLLSGARGHHPAAALWRAASPAGHAAIGWPEAGRIEAGATADLVTIGLDSPRLAGTAPAHALASVLFAAGAADVRGVVCGGRQLVREGSHVSIDVAAELEGSIGALAP